MTALQADRKLVQAILIAMFSIIFIYNNLRMKIIRIVFIFQMANEFACTVFPVSLFSCQVNNGCDSFLYPPIFLIINILRI